MRKYKNILICAEKVISTKYVLYKYIIIFVTLSTCNLKYVNKNYCLLNIN